LHTIKKRQSNVEIKMKIPAKNISQGAVHNYHKNMRALLGRALKFGIIQSSPYERMRGDIERGDVETVEFLTDEERDRIEALALTDGRVIAAARDMFLFQCYTGMAYADMMAFRLDNCRKSGDVLTYSAPRVKTGVWFYIQILPKALAIAEKYGGSMPSVCNEVFNRKLKDIAKMAGITKKLTTHVGRHTFATWALRNGVPIERLAKMLGHTKITQTQRYAKVLATDVYAEFEKLR
jgi:integrase